MQKTSLKQALSKARVILESKNIETARLDSEVLLAFSLGINRSEIFKDPDRLLTAEEVSKFNAFIDRRSRFEPVAYIRNKKEFFSIEFRVTPAVLIPRPETEHLVEAALDFVKTVKSVETIQILDIGTGSGALPVAILANVNFKGLASPPPAAKPHGASPSAPPCSLKSPREKSGREPGEIYVPSFVYASDLSEDALSIARYNVIANNLESKVKFIKSDLFENIEGEFDFILSNPPYVRTAEVDNLKNNGKLYEPRMALDGGEDGLKIIGRLIKDGVKFLKTGAAMLIEIGSGQAQTIRNIPDCEKYGSINFIKDLSGKERVLVLKR